MRSIINKKRINDVLHMFHTKYEFMVKIISYRTVCHVDHCYLAAIVKRNLAILESKLFCGKFRCFLCHWTSSNCDLENTHLKNRSERVSMCETSFNLISRDWKKVSEMLIL